MKKKVLALIIAAMLMVFASGCDNPNASKTDKVGSYASSPIMHEYAMNIG